MYYLRNLVAVKEIIETITESGNLINNVMSAINDSMIFEDLFYIHESYSSLVEVLNEFEDGKHTVESYYIRLKDINFNRDPTELKLYLEKRLKANLISSILNFDKINVSPAEYVALRKCNPTSVAVERSFLTLGKFLAKDRNLKKYTVLDVFHFITTKIMNLKML